MFNYAWPIMTVVIANTVYNICAKTMPTHAQPFASLSVAYFIAFVVSVILFFITSGSKNFFSEISKLNWTSVIFGISVVALEFGYIFIYRNGWNVSVAPLVANICLAMILLILGVILFKETITFKQVIGTILCFSGLILIIYK